MGEFPPPSLNFVGGAVIHTGHPCFATGGQSEWDVVNYAAAAWPVANLGMYIPFTIDLPITAKQMFWENGAAAGTTDIGIYDINGTRLVSLGATSNSGTTIQVGNITDTPLAPGTYYAAMVCSTVTTQTYWMSATTSAEMRCNGLQEEAIGSGTLPSSATFAAFARGRFPMIGICCQGTV